MLYYSLKKLTKSKIKCGYCQEVIESTHRHDFKQCGCGSSFIDGGTEMMRRFGGDNWTDCSEYEDKTLVDIVKDVERLERTIGMYPYLKAVEGELDEAEEVLDNKLMELYKFYGIENYSLERLVAVMDAQITRLQMRRKSDKFDPAVVFVRQG